MDCMETEDQEVKSVPKNVDTLAKNKDLDGKRTEDPEASISMQIELSDDSSEDSDDSDVSKEYVEQHIVLTGRTPADIILFLNSKEEEYE